MTQRQLQDLVDWLACSLGVGDHRFKAEPIHATAAKRLAGSRDWLGDITHGKKCSTIRVAADLSGPVTVATAAHELAHARQNCVGALSRAARVEPGEDYLAYRATAIEVEARCVESVTCQALFGGSLRDFNSEWLLPVR